MHSPPGRCAHGDAGDAEARAAAAAGDDEVERLPGGEPDDGRQDASAVEEPAAEGVEVVPVVFVGEEDGVDGGQLGEGQGGGGAVFEDGDAGVVLGAGGGELWVLSWLFFFFFFWRGMGVRGGLTKGSVRKLMSSMERMAVAVPMCVMLMVLLKLEDGIVVELFRRI